jgi:hypothetical protein
MTLGDSVILSLGGGFSWDDLATLVAFAKTFEMLGSWSSYRKTPVRTMAWLEPRLATSFFPRKIYKYSRPSQLLSNLQSSWQYSSILSSRYDHYVGLIDNEQRVPENLESADAECHGDP